MSAFGAPGITGALIALLPPETAAAKAGFLQNDLILRFGDANVQTAEDLFILTLQVFKTTQIAVSGLRSQRPFQLSIKLP
jgi:S1-C subfamily serine protease